MSRPAASRQKLSGAYYTPDDVARSLVSWAIRSPDDRMLDPSCGDGRFLAAHANSVGVEQDAESARAAVQAASSALVHEGDFFTWAAATHERFECAAGNPPFIRYQSFKGEVRHRAVALCRQLGAEFNGLASSWAPFLVAVTSLLKPAGKSVHAIIDNYATHKHPKVVAWLGRHPRWTFHFTPTSASWLNAVEGFFAVLTKRRLKRGVFKGVVELQAAINRFLADHNQQPKPFTWTADPDKIIAAASRGHQTLNSVH